MFICFATIFGCRSLSSVSLPAPHELPIKHVLYLIAIFASSALSLHCLVQIQKFSTNVIMCASKIIAMCVLPHVPYFVHGQGCLSLIVWQLGLNNMI